MALVQVSGRPNPFLWWAHRRGASAPLEEEIVDTKCWVLGLLICPILLSYSAPVRPNLVVTVQRRNRQRLLLVRPYMKKPTVSIPLSQRALPPLWMICGTGPTSTMDWCGLLTWQRSMSTVWFSSLPETKMLVLGRLLGLVQWVTLSRRWSVSSMSGGIWNLTSVIHPGCYLRWTVPARGPRPMISLPLPICADPQRKSFPSPSPTWGFGSGMGTPTVDNRHCPPEVDQ